jgi:hypothetical protein
MYLLDGRTHYVNHSLLLPASSFLLRETDDATNVYRLAGMADWGPVVIATVLFVLLTPGLLFQLPAHGRIVGFGTMHTSGITILVHAVLYFALITIFLVAIGVHIYAG